MLVVMQSDATPENISRVLEAIHRLELTPHPLPGTTRTAIGITGNTGVVDTQMLEVLPGVKECIRVTKPYKLASREMHRDDTVRSADGLRRSRDGIRKSGCAKLSGVRQRPESVGE